MWKFSHYNVNFNLQEKNKEDVVLHFLIWRVQMNDDAGILHSNQCDCSNFMQTLKKSTASILIEILKIINCHLIELEEMTHLKI